MRKERGELVELCQYAARHPRFVQGGGGNCSVKSGTVMAVKASGYFLEDISPEKGIAFVDLKTGLASRENREKPSMESPLHGLLGTYVIHTHPVAVAALVCAKEGKDIFKTFFPGKEYLWIEYAAPGRKIFEAVRAALSKTPGTGLDCQVLLLQNHGLFAAASTKENCIRIHETTVTLLENFFGPDSFNREADIPEGFFLTPDHVVYGTYRSDSPSEKQESAVTETRQFARQVLALIQSKGWTPNWLEAREVRYLTEMEDEKYRQALWRKPG